MTDRIVKPAHTRTRVISQVDDRKTRTLQSEKTHSNINTIVAKAHRSGRLPLLMHRQPLPVLPDAITYQEALDKVVQAQQSFERLPASVRAEFQNRPENMLMALEKSKTDPLTKKSLQTLGLLNPDTPEIVPPAPAEPLAP